tara:strand:+ start:5271 stop:5618 length:348 start_codon:yes stop_codon:yes gene_type:complete
MSDKNKIIDLVRRWVIFDDKIKNLQKELTTLRKEKKTITENLTSIMKENNIDEFDINNGKLVYTRSKIKAPLSKKHLLNSLNQFYKNDSDMVIELTKFIMESREEVTKDQIKHKD